jgi:hypothetical protein
MSTDKADFSGITPQTKLLQVARSRMRTYRKVSRDDRELVGLPLNLNFRVPAPSWFSKGLGLDSPILESPITPKISAGNSPSAF